MFHLGWFANFAPQGWHSADRDHGYRWDRPDLQIDAVRALERGGFDLVLLEDNDMVPDAFGGSSEVYLRNALEAPKLDPLPFIPLLAAATKHIGLVATAPTSFYPPYLLARQFATLDHITAGRVGWNIVTGTSDRAAQNYGLSEHYEHDQRYEMATEYVDLVSRLWASWEPDAVRADMGSGVFADHAKVHTIDFEGQYYQSRGPLNVPMSPQGRPVYAQAGGSPRGRRFAAAHAELVVASVNTVADMRSYREDLRRQMVEIGRNPDTCKLMFVATPTIGSSEAEARRLHDVAREEVRKHPELVLAELSAFSNIDFSLFDQDLPLPELTTNGSQSSLAQFRGDGTQTLRDIVASRFDAGDLDLIGTAETVALRMAEIMEEVGGDGFLISSPLVPRYVSQIVDELVPQLRRRDLIRTSYPHATFRENLMEF